MPIYILRSNDQSIQTEETPFAGGGEGNLYRVLSPSHQQYIAKVYHPAKQTARRESKLQYLVRNPPRELSISGEGALLMAWPKDLIYDEEGKFVGFIMPYMEGEKLESLCTTKLPKKMQSGSWKRFDFANKDALKLRQKLCFNIAAALHNVHDTGRYVMIDLKPDNILVQPNGLIGLVDMDSIAVVHGGATLFDAPVATPEYTPPEGFGKDFKRELAQQETWDRFSLSVIFYKLLFGIHPYAATCAPPFDRADTLDEKIKLGLFVHTQTERGRSFSIVPQPHRHFNRIHIALRELFVRCFDAGTLNPHHRPRAEEWCYAILTGQQAQETYALPSELFDLPALPYADKSFQKLFDTWHELRYQAPELRPMQPQAEQMISFSSYGISTELRLMNFVLFGISWTMLFLQIRSPLAFLWGGLIVLSGYDLYGYLLRPERKAKLQAQQRAFLLERQYERDKHSADAFFERMNQLWKPLDELYKRIPLDKVRQWLTEQNGFRRRIDAFKQFLEQQDILTQKIIEKEESESKNVRAQQQRQLLEDPFLSKLAGTTVSQKLQSLLQIENQALEQVESDFAERKKVFELHIEKHQRIIELNEQTSQIEELLAQLRDHQTERIEQEAKQKRQLLLEHKRRQVMGTRNDIRANAALIFGRFNAPGGAEFVYQFIDKCLLHEGIIEATQVRNIVTSLPAKEFYWEDKNHVVYLRDRMVKIPERYDQNHIEQALKDLHAYARKLEQEVFSTELSPEENQALDADLRQRLDRHRRRITEKEAQLRDVLQEKAEIEAQLSANEALSLEQLEREYNEAIRLIKERYVQAKNFLRECMEQLVQDRKTFSSPYIQAYEQLVEECRSRHEQLENDLNAYSNLLSQNDHDTIQTFLQLQAERFPQLLQMEKEFDPVREQAFRSAQQCSDAQYQALRYRDITFRNHLRQLFLLK